MRPVQAIYVPADDLTDPAPATTFSYLDSTTVLMIRWLKLTKYNILNYCTSAQVGWIPIKLWKSAIFAPSLTAKANPWVISPAFGPSICNPTTRFWNKLCNGIKS